MADVENSNGASNKVEPEASKTKVEISDKDKKGIVRQVRFTCMFDTYFRKRTHNISNNNYFLNCIINVLLVFLLLCIILRDERVPEMLMLCVITRIAPLCKRPLSDRALFRRFQPSQGQVPAGTDQDK